LLLQVASYLHFPSFRIKLATHLVQLELVPYKHGQIGGTLQMEPDSMNPGKQSVQIVEFEHFLQPIEQLRQTPYSFFRRAFPQSRQCPRSSGLHFGHCLKQSVHEVVPVCCT
jgi:hypothetical protein